MDKGKEAVIARIQGYALYLYDSAEGNIRMDFRNLVELRLDNHFALGVDVAPANPDADWGEAILEVECLIKGR